MARRVIRREAIVLVVAASVAVAGAAAYYFSRATTLTLAVAPQGGTELALFQAYADALKAGNKDIRLKILSFDGVRESAEALKTRKVDLAVVRPDVALPGNGLTLAVLREQAVLVITPEASGIKTMPALAGRRLGFIAQRVADKALITGLLEHDGLSLVDPESGAAVPDDTVGLVGLEEKSLAAAFAEKRIDAVVVVTTPTTPAARRIVGLVAQASPDHDARLIGVQDAVALNQRNPKLATVTIPAGLFGGNPKMPAEDVTTVGASYRLMARANLPRSVAASVTQHLFEMRAGLAETNPAANAIRAPRYETTADATSAKLPIHPGAIDYFEREQESFIERYETWIYLVAFFGGGVGSILAWLRQRFSRLRRERLEVATERLLDIRDQARTTTEAARLAELADEVDGLASDIARFALHRHAEARTMNAAKIAIEAARSTVMRNAALLDSRQSPTPRANAVD
ncbi:TAXI family TRAP transporter solute-binding subunit [Methylobacterium sp. WL9]|uniref:TAXI family TRAP transporter solute-binding subunit n=1 Tax=Methylobacterium sp. WL9 TaxID=2603898 RepID=UPI0011CB3B64|nr:TAXI family TRAP transporter solute-binding subunit [Methylobacterium sp. WL9]TXN21177.1 C4-dicarboxylate ABC transporter substrate-binding protein [Methylobacterium sp. WL9]